MVVVLDIAGIQARLSVPLDRTASSYVASKNSCCSSSSLYTTFCDSRGQRGWMKPVSSTYGTAADYQTVHLYARRCQSYARGCNATASEDTVRSRPIHQHSVLAHAEISSRGPSASSIVKYRSIAALGSRSSRSEGRSAWLSCAESEVASVSCIEWHLLAVRLLHAQFSRTLPGARLRSLVAKGANLTSTFSFAFGENGASFRAGWGP